MLHESFNHFGLIVVSLSPSLPQLTELLLQNLRKQVMTTNLWIEQYWYDYKLRWNPEEYGGVNSLHVPSTHIWLPDIVLYNKY